MEQLNEVHNLFIKQHSSDFTSDFSVSMNLSKNEGVNCVTDHLFPHSGISSVIEGGEVNLWKLHNLRDNRRGHGRGLRHSALEVWNGLGRLLVLLILETSVVIWIVSLLAIVVATATASSASLTTTIVPSNILYLLLLGSALLI